MKTILQDDTDYCIICGRYGTEIHHVFFGTANRRLSTKYDLLIGLCPEHHRGKNGNAAAQAESYSREMSQE